MPRTRKPKGKSLRIRRDLSRLGLGMLQISAYTYNQRTLEKANAIVTKLIEDSQVEVLRALQAGRVKIHQLVELDRQNKLSGSAALANVLLDQPLWATWEAITPKLATSKDTRNRYTVSRKALQRVLANDALKVNDLLGLDWAALAAGWPNSPSDWNHVGRAVSRFLSVLLEDKYHPFRRQVCAKIPTFAESARVPDVSPALFWAIVRELREDIRPVFVTIVLTGLRVRTEYLQLDETCLLPHTHQIRVPGDAVTAERYVAVDPQHWGWVVAAVPSPLQYKAIRSHWRAACTAAGAPVLWIHDLRHAMAQWAVDGGADVTEAQAQLGHANVEMSARYAKKRNAARVAGIVGQVLKEAANG